MRRRWTIAWGFVLAFLASGLLAASAAATAPVDLGAGFVTDEVGALTADELSAAELRLQDLASEGEADLFVVFVDDFTNPSTAQDWANDVAEQNGLGPQQYLLAIATEGRNYYISADEDGPLSFARVTEIEQNIQPYLSDEDWAGAIDRAASEFAAGTGAGGSGLGTILIVLLVAAVIAFIVWLVLRSRRRKRAAAPPAPDPNDPYATVSDEELASRVGSALVQADDAITSSKEELGFAVAQFGIDSTDRFTKVVQAAEAKIADAFSLQQKLDDEIPDTAAQIRAWRIQILQLCEAADDLLEDNVEEFESLRQLEQDAPQALERVKVRRAAVQEPLAAAPTTLATLTQIYDASALSPVAENVTQAEERLRLADAEIAEAQQQLQAGTRGEAAFSIRTAEEAIAQAEQLVGAVTTRGADLSALEEKSRALISDLQADLAAASHLPDPQGQLAPLVARTRSHVDEAVAALQATPRDPQRILDALDAANTQIDAVIGQIRDAMQVAQRNQRLLEQRLMQAQAQISAANQFIATRRGAVGATPRTRLAEASAALSEAHALQASDTTRALQQATRAYQLAREATSAAESEVSMFSTGGYGGYGGGGGLGGDILGGIIGGILSSGGGRSYRSGGSSWRSSGGSSRGYRPSGFGGSRGGSRGGGSRGRSGGGRF